MAKTKKFDRPLLHEEMAMQSIALADNNVLRRFDSEIPDQTTAIAVTGVEGTLLGSDTHPADGLVYGVSTTNDVYTING